ncbi:hypothetical protein DPMN_150467 [Dreissena polymorpha]|uniref:Uncharacterized protein n=1 Tax=Dreissena polymorpha TaxID=45954 RepID=A0A9D4FI16_DREPO|nr:hypothetical protein DPMN_150467 [Dreissena polymorpha]
MFKCLYPAFCVRVKRPGFSAVEKDGDYEGFVEPVLGEEADGTDCKKPTQSGHRCGCRGNLYSDLSGTGTFPWTGLLPVPVLGRFIELLAVRGDVCTCVGPSFYRDLRLFRANLHPVCSCFFVVSVGEILEFTAGDSNDVKSISESQI